MRDYLQAMHPLCETSQFGQIADYLCGQHDGHFDLYGVWGELRHTEAIERIVKSADQSVLQSCGTPVDHDPT
jgi:hypothetical protein